MNLMQSAVDFAVIFAVALAVNLAVTYVYGRVVHGAGVLEWGSAFAFAISLGIVLPLVRRGENKKGRG